MSPPHPTTTSTASGQDKNIVAEATQPYPPALLEKGPRPPPPAAPKSATLHHPVWGTRTV